MEFKDRFKLLLDAQGVSMYRISKDTGIAQQLVASYKKGTFEPKHENMIVLAAFFKVSETWLRTGLGDPYTEGKDAQTEQFLASLQDMPDILKKARELLDKHLDPEIERVFKGETTELYKKLLAEVPKKVEKPKDKEERLLQLIESQQRTIESLQQTINMLVDRKGGDVQREGDAKCADVG